MMAVLRRINKVVSLVKFEKEFKEFNNEYMDKTGNKNKVSSDETSIEMGENGNGWTRMTDSQSQWFILLKDLQYP